MISCQHELFVENVAPYFQLFRSELRLGVGRIHSVWSVFLALLASNLFAVFALAQSELSIPRVSSIESVFSVTNPSDEIIEVELALLGLEGGLGPGAANPVRYEIQPRGTLSMSVGELFATSHIDRDGNWVQMSSRASGLTSVFFEEAFDSNFKSVSHAYALEDQLVLIPAGSSTVVRRELRVVNPSQRTASINISVFDNSGGVVAITSSVLPKYSVYDIDLATLTGGLAELLTARVNSNVPVAAQAAVTSEVSTILLNGQSASSGAASIRVAPHVLFGNGSGSTLLVANPTGQAVEVNVEIARGTGEPLRASQFLPRQRTVMIPSNGSVALDTIQLTGLTFSPTMNGWLQLESPAVSLATSLIITQNSGVSAYPLQRVGTLRSYYPRQNGSVQFKSIALTNLNSVEAVVDLAVVNLHGNTVSRATRVVGRNSKENVLVSDLFPLTVLNGEGWLGVESSVAIYSTMMVSEPNGAYITAVEPQPLPSDFEFNSLSSRPVLVSVTPREVNFGDRLNLRIRNAEEGVTLVFGGEVIEPLLLSGQSLFVADVPQMAPGFVDLRLRFATGEESEPVTILVRPTDQLPLREIKGRAFYQKVVSTSTGLNLKRPVAVPIRGARVEILDQSTGTLFAVGTTDDEGNYRIVAPAIFGYTIRILSTATRERVTVADNTHSGAVYAIGSPLGVEQPLPMVATDESRISGAFNILEVMRLGNRVLAQVEPGLPSQDLTIFWNPRNSRSVGNPANGAIGGTFFDAASNTAFIMGDRSVDSDEFDDAVILHEYAHMLAARFSSDDSVGGLHFVGDVLDPRVAWSEGWANFFSSLVRQDPVYRDTFGEDGRFVVEYNLDVNVVAGDLGGYSSESSIHSLLWDLVDVDGEGGDDAVAIDFEAVWQAFCAMSARAYVYAPSFLDELVKVQSQEVVAIEQLARSLRIDYLANADPTVSNPFPRFVTGNVSVTGEVDSLTRNRANLAKSAHFYSFDVNDGPVSIRLDVIGLGLGNNPQANDLDIFLMDASGRDLVGSDHGQNGQSELISTILSAGHYVVEVRSYYIQASTGKLVYNSGAYRLTILTP